MEATTENDWAGVSQTMCHNFVVRLLCIGNKW